MRRKSILAKIMAAALVTLPVSALSQPSPSPATASNEPLVQRYITLAGSEDNAKSLVNGLSTGTEVKLASSATPFGPATSFTPATGKMGLGSVNIALALAQASLKEQGITNPTPEQLQAALNGGTVGNTRFSGVLQMRAEGKDWGKIAQSIRVKLGEAIRSARSDAAR